MPSMAFPLRPALLAALLLPLCALAQDEAPRGGEPKVERKVTEDDGVRIEELRVRGQTQAHRRAKQAGCEHAALRDPAGQRRP